MSKRLNLRDSVPPPVLCRSDYRGLKAVLENDMTELVSDEGCRRTLRDRLAAATIVDDDQVPATAVAMHSAIVLATASGERDAYTLVFPEEADIFARKLSVTAPVGVAILGQHVGQTLRFPAPGGYRELRIDRVTPARLASS